jgi:ABC-type bacteriocin/lantibiotic exporter with double-glycine peptidase domain
VKYPFIQQASEEDCGAACLATIAKFYGKNYALSRVREMVGTGQKGTTLLGLRRGAEKFGFNGRSAKANSEIVNQLNEITLPAIINWRGYHYVVLYGEKNRQFIIADPGIGIRYITKEELLENWYEGIILLLEPDPIRFSEQKEDQVKGFGRFFRRIIPYKNVLFLALIINLLLGLLSLASPFFLQILTDDVLVRGDTKILKGLAIAIIVMTIISSSLSFIQANLIAQFSQRLQLGLVMEFGRKILRLPLNYYEARRSGEIVSRLQDIQELNQLVSQVVTTLPSQFFIALISFGFMLFYSWKLSLVVVGLTVLTTLATVIFIPILQQKIRNALVFDSENQGVLVEIFKGALTLKVTTSYSQFWEELQRRFGRVAKLVLNVIQIGIINSTSSGLISGIGGVIILWYGSTLVIKNELTIGQLLAFNSMNSNFNNFISSIISFIDEFTRVKTATQRITEVIDHPSEEEIEDNKPIVKIADNVDINLSKINFFHIGRVGLLEDFSVTIPGGKVTAIIGKSGCGKSTIAKLLTGLYKPQSGNICLGDYNLEDLSLESVRNQVILIPQEAHFWSRSILENFYLGAENITFEQIVTACKIAEADEFIKELPGKYNTVLGEFGANISGGQRQRLAIARAIIKNPAILILDESTAGLDPISEVNLLDKLLENRKGKTTILISHRSRVIKRAEHIIYLEKGQLKLQGNIAELKTYQGEHLDFLE